MARKRFNSEQIVAILREAERGADQQALFRKHGICEQTCYRWKRMYGGLRISEVQRIKALEEENRKLKQLAGEQALVIETMSDHLCHYEGWTKRQAYVINVLRRTNSEGAYCPSSLFIHLSTKPGQNLSSLNVLVNYLKSFLQSDIEIFPSFNHLIFPKP